MLVKYPRTYHLPFSQGRSNDDKVHEDLSVFAGKQLVATLKMDGENTTMYRDAIHARSLSSARHPSRDWVKKFWSTVASEIPEGWRVCGENLFARHSISYEDLRSYFYVFSIWNESNVCLSWNETKEWADLLGLTLVDEVAVNFNIDQIDEVHEVFEKTYAKSHEGYVIRNMSSFPYSDFIKNVGKFVRSDHVQTGDHWMFQEVVPNKLGQFDKLNLLRKLPQK